MRMMNPSVMVSRLDLVVLELAAAGIVFRRLPEGFWIFRVFIEQRAGAGGSRGGHNPPGARGPPCAPWWVVPPSEPPSGTFLAQQVCSGLEKFSKKFCCVWTPFGIDFLRSKKQGKNNNWH